MYNKEICNKIKVILEFYFQYKITDLICEFIWDYINIQIPLSIDNSLIDVPYGVKNRLITVYDTDTITIKFKEDELPNHIEYIGQEEDLNIEIFDLNMDKFKILKSILNYHVGYDISEFKKQKLRISLRDISKYKIPIILPDKSDNILPNATSLDDDYVFVEDYKSFHNSITINKVIQDQNVGEKV
ncbi:MAG: hypothetical protein ACFFD1_11455, partial [Candidatus Thorarchaeota archaeon]